jgi:hypothetical protein
MKQRYSDAAARTKAADSADSVEYDDYAPVFQKIMPDAGTSADQKLDDAIRRIVDETVGDIPSPKKGGPIMNAASSGRKKHTGLKIFGLVLILVIAALATTYCVFAYQYRTKFLDGTIINGIDASEKTAAQVEAVIKQQVENYEITLTFVKYCQGLNQIALKKSLKNPYLKPFRCESGA